MNGNGGPYLDDFVKGPEFAFKIRLTASKHDAIERVIAALKAEGFVVLSSIELDQAFIEEIGDEFRPYTIIGACHRSLAYAALTSAPEIGLMFPCNITVEADINGSLVRIMNPAAPLRAGETAIIDRLAPLAHMARERLQRVAEELRRGRAG